MEKPRGSFSAPVRITMNGAVGSPAARTTCFAKALSRVMAQEAGSEPVYGMRSSSRSAGTSDSR